ncbi:PREDICTED: uncharacterized protein LOC109209195 [Nicotiana attenuata]|uniref:Uncharacterized protein n=1 Tax=Nicotiana attenuata TaxID=49451 RepID=A0A314KPF0_NICAT|nr:PREDICTED: uncharacterized protein LOC109209195 [Nicotiana attenuata]OIT31055.1 hypothetical protein A4A49_34801 [Nicotiana attenuata]
MPFPMKVQPINSSTYRESVKNDIVKPPVLKSRLKRFFDRPFPSVLRISSAAEKPSAAGAANDGALATEFEPSSVCLDKMVENFIEENNEKPSAAKFGRKCNCFNGNSNDSSDDEFDFSTGFSDSVTNSSFGDSSDTLKSLIPCASVAERNLLADTSKIVEKHKSCKRKDDLRKIVTDELLALGYKASTCKSRWEKTSSVPAGEYEYVDVTVEGERVMIDLDFRSEFEIARSTGSYKAVLQLLPFIFVGKADRIQQIVSIVSEAARQSLKKKGMHIAPWRKPEYMKAKWLSPYTRITPAPRAAAAEESDAVAESKEAPSESKSGELNLIFGDKSSPLDSVSDEMKSPSLNSSPSEKTSGEEVKPLQDPVMMMWQPPAVKPKSCDRGSKVVVTGLASLLREKP